MTINEMSRMLRLRQGRWVTVAYENFFKIWGHYTNYN